MDHQVNKKMLAIVGIILLVVLGSLGLFMADGNFTGLTVENSFSVGPVENISQENLTDTDLTQPIKEEPIEETSKITPLKRQPVDQDNVLRKQDKFIGKKINDGEIELYFTLIEQTPDKLILEFQHNSDKPENIFVEAEQFTLDKNVLPPNETARLEILLVQNITPRLRLSVGTEEGFAVTAPRQEVFEIGKIIPVITTNARHRLLDRADEKLDLEITQDSSRALIQGITAKNIKTKISKTTDQKPTTEIIALEPIEIEQAVITLEKDDDVNTIIECLNISLETMTCLAEWQVTAIPFIDNGTHITFTAANSSSYGGAELKVINVQSFPEVNGNWTVMFNTTGTANLTITAINNTFWTDYAEEGYDLKFLELRCGETLLNYTWINNSVFYPNYFCNQRGQEISKVLTSGKHTLKFQFGDSLDYARNLASANLSCQVRQTACNADEVGIMRMSDPADAHPSIISDTDYTYIVCCKDLDNRNNLTNSSGYNIVNLSSSTDGHLETPSVTDYALGVYMNASVDNVSCSYDSVSGNCGENKTCLFTLSGTTDAHVADCTTDPYSLTACCGFQINNRAPSLTQLIINSTGLTNKTAENLTCYAQGSDQDNDNLTAYYQWFKNSVLNSSGSLADILPDTLTLITALDSSQTASGETWTCSILMGDGTVNETNWNNQTLTIKNTAPTHSKPWIGAHQPTGSTVDSGLISYWQFEHASNKTGIAIDAVGSSNGTLSSPTFTDDGRIGSAYEFDGIDDYIDVNDNPFDLTGDITVVAWIYPKIQGSDYHGIVSKTANDSNGWEIRTANYTSTTTNVQFRINGDLGAPAETTINNNQWYSVIGTYNGSETVLYINGARTKNKTYSAALTTNNNNLQIGKSAYSGLYFNGSIDEVMIYNRTLSAAEIQEIYLDAATNSPTYITTDQDIGASSNNTQDVDNEPVNRIFNWFRNGKSITVLNMPFETNSSAIAKDYSGHSYNGTINGATWTDSGRNGSTGAYTFNGVNNWISFSSYPNVTATQPFTISFWFKSFTGSSDAGLVITSLGGYGCTHHNGAVLSCYVGNESNVLTRSVGLNSWTHVVFSWDGTNTNNGMKLYVNGILEQKNSTYNITAATAALEIGRETTYFNGSIDEVMIYNHTLSPEQIQAHYNLEYNRIVSQETEVGDVWYAQITPNDMAANTDGPTEQTDNITINASVPDAPVLLVPLNNASIIAPSPTFIWNNSDDPLGGNLTYQILVDDSSAFDAPEINISSITEGLLTNTSYNATVELTLDRVYYWKVRANNSQGYGNFSEVFNFTLESQLSIDLVVNNVSFGYIYPDETNDTEDNAPPPFLVENTGNLYANITVTGEPLFVYGNFPSIYYMFKIGINKTGAFDFGQSTTVYTNITNVSSTIDISNLNWRDTNDTAEIDINITAPLGEPPGTKTSNITLRIV